MVSPNRSASLTFDQLGNMGKPLNTMKLDEFFKNVISVEEAHFNPSSSSSSSTSSSSSSTSPFFFGNFESNKKQVDDVWKEINNINPMDNQQIGVTTLEDFLVRAGVINGVNNQNAMINHSQQQIMAIDPMVMVSQQSDWLQLQMAAEAKKEAEQQRQMTVISNFHVPESVFDNSGIDVGYGDNQLSMSMTAISATSNSESPAEKKQRYLDEMMVKTIERRQKRMIKNRESAARSRARKQAYTSQLEHEVFQLKNTNAFLKKLKEKEMVLFSDPISTPRYQLRRTSSASF